jgi:hypothetical protein
MRHHSFTGAVLLLAAGAFSAPVFALGPEAEEAIALLKQMHADQCAKRQIQGKLLSAHQAHDQKTLDELAPKLDAVNGRLKPGLDKLKALKPLVKKNQADQTAFESAQLNEGDCD